MKKQYKFIFDLDGTLYPFDKGKSTRMVDSLFYVDLKENVYRFLMDLKNITKKEAVEEYKRINYDYGGEVSLGIRVEYNIPHSKYFNAIWNLQPRRYVKKNDQLKALLTPFVNRSAMLTQGPRIWVERVLEYLDLKEIFNDNIITGESFVRKPNPLIFQRVASLLSKNNSNIISIGDQEESDILPAKIIGMKTIRIGKGKTLADYQVDSIQDAVQLLRKGEYI